MSSTKVDKKINLENNLTKQNDKTESINKKNITKYLSRDDLLMKSIINFFRDKDYFQQMVDIINKKTKLSLRILDYFAVIYSKKKAIAYPLKINNKKLNYIVAVGYKAQLKAYSKKYFDPFNRDELITLYDHNNEPIQTTICQLNFLKWAIKFKVTDYVLEHLDEIEEHSKQLRQQINSLKTKQKNSKHMNISATKSMNKHRVTINVNFE
jgi:hypothetical protein